MNIMEGATFMELRDVLLMERTVLADQVTWVTIANAVNQTN